VVKLAAVIITAWFCRATWRDLRPVPGARALGLAVVVGLLVAVGWVGLERLPYPRIGVGGSRQAFDPGVLAPLGRAGFLAARLLGLVVVVPVIEELFWRSFLNRVIQDPDFWKLPVGQVTVVSAAVTAGLFAAAHPEWLPALLTGLSWAWLLHHTRSLLACVASHAVANAALGGYVLATGSWELW
jgi:CAAX prenyl protease-like protein